MPSELSAELTAALCTLLMAIIKTQANFWFLANFTLQWDANAANGLVVQLVSNGLPLACHPKNRHET